MNKYELDKIIVAVEKECKKNFDTHKTTEFTLANLTVIPFASRTISTRKVSDWGTDEDRDEYIWYSQDGWQHADMTVQIGAGANEVIDKQIELINPSRVANILLAWDLFSQMEFIHTAYSILRLSEFRSELF